VAGTLAPRRHSVSRGEDGHGCGSPKRGSAAGHIDIASKPGAGTTVTLRLPLTLAIIDGLRGRVGHAYFVLPLKMNLVRFMK
jgi:hypothetical protein